VRLKLSSGKQLEVDIALICAGRSANTDGIGLEKAGVPMGKRGLLEVDARFRTKVPHIAAVGDVIGFPSLASTSMEQAPPTCTVANMGTALSNVGRRSALSSKTTSSMSRRTVAPSACTVKRCSAVGTSENTRGGDSSVATAASAVA
jgi:pyruvate/2-oxoglutarate dehydrogenase complex dihydrolipoamide dehydrogenase (E3) component